MRTLMPRIALPAVALAVALAACSDSTSPGPNDDVTLEDIMSELNTVGAYAGAGLAPAGLGATGAPVAGETACPYDAATMFFVCPDRQHNELTLSARYQILDAAGTPLSAFDPATVSGFRNVADVSGTVQQPAPLGGTMTIESHQEQTMTGLRTAARTINGTGTSNHTITNGEQTMEVTTTNTITDLVIPRTPAGTRPYPTSGTVTHTATSENLTFSSTMTFNGTSTVTIVTTTNGVSRTCTFNLETPQTPPVCS